MDLLSFPSCPFCGDALAAHSLLCLPDDPWHGPVCRICGQPLLGELSDLCWTCRSRSWHLDGGFFAFPYRGLWKLLIQDYKIALHRGHSVFLGQIMASLVQDFRPLVPVPGNPRNNRKRGFDPVTLLVREICKAKKLPVLDILVRTEGESLKHLGRKDRRDSISGEISLRVPAGGLPSAVYLVDDIFTTGATADHCAGLLKQAGIPNVAVLAAAGP